jgi:cytochrome c553
VYQLKLWRAGSRGGTFGELMSSAASSLTDQEIRAVAAYYAGLGARHRSLGKD